MFLLASLCFCSVHQRVIRYQVFNNDTMSIPAWEGIGPIFHFPPVEHIPCEKGTLKSMQIYRHKLYTYKRYWVECRTPDYLTVLSELMIIKQFWLINSTAYLTVPFLKLENSQKTVFINLFWSR